MASSSGLQFAPPVARQGQRNERRERLGGHRRQVAQIRGQRLPADPPRFVLAELESRRRR